MSIQNLGPLLVVGESTGSIGLDGEKDFHAALNNMASQAKRSVKIFTQELDPELYDQPEFLKIMSDIARNRQRCKIQILIQSPDKAASAGIALLNCKNASHLPSKSIAFPMMKLITMKSSWSLMK